MTETDNQPTKKTNRQTNKRMSRRLKNPDLTLIKNRSEGEFRFSSMFVAFTIFEEK